jgi:hypothetical protein
VIKGSKSDAPPPDASAENAARIAELEARARASQGKDNGQPVRKGPANAGAPGAGSGPPQIVAPAVGFGLVVLNGHRYDVGTVWALSLKGANYLVTAFHIFEQEKQPLPWSELPDKLGATDPLTGEVLATGGPPLPIADAHRDNNDVSHDIAAYSLGESHLTLFSLAAKDPAAGENVWALCRFPDQSGPAILHEATVLVLNEQKIVFRYKVPGQTTGTSGAPILNASGEVVGLVVGGGTGPDGQPFAIGNPRAAIAREIASGMR